MTTSLKLVSVFHFLGCAGLFSQVTSHAFFVLVSSSLSPDFAVAEGVLGHFTLFLVVLRYLW